MKICANCHKRPSRVRPSRVGDSGVTWCMKCAEERGILRYEDYDPEPEGFTEFLKVVTGGPI
jgi:hypothetical protein